MIVACDSKAYTASKWIILPAKDLIRTRKDRKISFGDRVWLVSYWFSTRNVKVDMPEYLPRARGAPCRHIVPYGETYVICRTCSADVLCMRCFRDLDCRYHSPGVLEPEYLPRAITLPPPAFSPWIHPTKQQAVSLPTSAEGSSSTSLTATSTDTIPSSQQRCGHIFQPGEDIYHCQNCSFNDMVVLCSRCFHNSGCVKHRWRMGVFQPPQAQTALANSSSRPSTPIVESLAIIPENEQENENENECDSTGKVGTSEQQPTASQQITSIEGVNDEEGGRELDPTSGTTLRASCDCGDPAMFKTSFDCSYHLPQEFRPLPALTHCNYLFQLQETMFRCRTCHLVGQHKADSAVPDADTPVLSDIWICSKCFDPEDHAEHQVEERINEQNEGLHCHCGDPTILRHRLANAADGALPANAAASTTDEAIVECRDDHNRQTVLCTTDIKEGDYYYKCERQNPSRNVVGVARIVRSGSQHIVNSTSVLAEQMWSTGANTELPLGNGSHSAGSVHTNHAIQWVKADQDMSYSCACGSHSLSRLGLGSIDTSTMTAATEDDHSTSINIIHPPPLCQYHTMIYKTTPSTTLYLHSHNHRAMNHEDHCEVTGYKYHDSDNDWIMSRPEHDAEFEFHSPQDLFPYLQWKDVFWLKHANTGRFLNSMASLKISQGFQEVSALGAPHSNNDWIAEETTWVRQHILSEE
ncbi:hypothetical protein EDD11_008031 [Mortierella claussenii]|nr:hypothetical protein EDD11_008031 [Mortierella claussenii]